MCLHGCLREPGNCEQILASVEMDRWANREQPALERAPLWKFIKLTPLLLLCLVKKLKAIPQKPTGGKSLVIQLGLLL